MKVTVLFGGPSAEREVSLVSGRSVIEGLKAAGHEVFASDIGPDDLSALQRPADVIFPVLHGQFGESGELQEILEQRNLAFVGSGSAASKAGMDKDLSKRLWLRADLPTAHHRVVNDADHLAKSIAFIGAPCVVKPIASGSSIDVHICKTAAHAQASGQQVIAAYGSAMVEKFVKGIELTVGILEDSALSPIRITTTHEFFDYSAKYVGNSAQHHFDTTLPADVIDKVKEISLQAHKEINARDLSRIDVIVDEKQRPWLLEINTMPGFTPKSLLPEMAAHDGVPFSMLVDRLVVRAALRQQALRRVAG